MASQRAKAVQEAAEAHTNLTVFAAVVSLLEGGHLYGSASNDAAALIIDLCRDEQQRCLRAYDLAVAKATH